MAVAKSLHDIVQYFNVENRSWFTNSKHLSQRMNEHFGLCNQWKSRCAKNLMRYDGRIDVTSLRLPTRYISGCRVSASVQSTHVSRAKRISTKLSRLSRNGCDNGNRQWQENSKWKVWGRVLRKNVPNLLAWHLTTPRSDHPTTSLRSVSLPSELSWQGCRPLRCRYCSFDFWNWFQISVLHQVVNKRYSVFSSSCSCALLTVFLAGCYSTT